MAVNFSGEGDDVYRFTISGNIHGNLQAYDADRNGKLSAYEICTYLIRETGVDAIHAWRTATCIVETATGQDAGNPNSPPAGDPANSPDIACSAAAATLTAIAKLGAPGKNPGGEAAADGALDAYDIEASSIFIRDTALNGDVVAGDKISPNIIDLKDFANALPAALKPIFGLTK